MSQEQLARFDFFPARTKEDREHHGKVREVCKEAADQILSLTPQGREQALAITKLEEAMFWANAAVARDSGRPAEDLFANYYEGDKSDG
jgi:hypothetical protein